MSLLDKASLIVTANAEKAGKLYSVVPSNGNGDMDVVRGTTATRVNSLGLIENVAVNEPRLNYDTVGGCPAILIEPQRTNVLLYSGDLSQSVWVKPNYTLQSTSNIQGLVSTRIVKNSTNNGYYVGTGSRNLVNNIGTFAAGIKTLTFLIRKGNTEKVGFVINQILVGALTVVFCEFNFNTKTFSNVSLGLTVSFKNLITDVYEIAFTINDTGTSTLKSVWISPIDSSNNTIDGGYLDFAFAQWELGAYPTSYIPTLGSAQTRNGDVISKNGISSLLNPSAGTIFFELSALNTVDFESRAISISNGEITSNQVLFQFLTNGSLRFDTYSSGGTNINRLILTSIIITNFNKIALSWSSSGVFAYVNGVKYTVPLTQGTITAVPTNLSRFDYGQWYSSNLINSKVKSSIIFKSQLTDTECINLTTL